MKKILFLLLACGLFSFPTQATERWERELESYASEILNYSKGELLFSVTGNSTLMVGTCTANALVVAATAIADTYPLTNFIAESFANMSYAEYETFNAEAFVSLQTLANTGRGTLGGAAVATLESFQFLVLWLSGREDEGFQATKKVYESTLRTFQGVYSRQGKCFQSFAKVYLALSELNHRHKQKYGDMWMTMDEDWLMP